MRLTLQARRRALGNIQFIGQLYKARMLTEKIMHSCIQTLLEEVSPALHATCIAGICWVSYQSWHQTDPGACC